MAQINNAPNGELGWYLSPFGPAVAVKSGGRWYHVDAPGEREGDVLPASKPVFESEAEAVSGKAKPPKKIKAVKKTARTYAEMSVPEEL